MLPPAGITAHLNDLTDVAYVAAGVTVGVACVAVTAGATVGAAYAAGESVRTSNKARAGGPARACVEVIALTAKEICHDRIHC
jgi:hypothetical protein